nr:MAG TPA: hypothetical protein [Caudoviricetes sp.]
MSFILKSSFNTHFFTREEDLEIGTVLEGVDVEKYVSDLVKEKVFDDADIKHYKEYTDIVLESTIKTSLMRGKVLHLTMSLSILIKKPDEDFGNYSIWYNLDLPYMTIGTVQGTTYSLYDKRIDYALEHVKESIRQTLLNYYLDKVGEDCEIE